MEKIINNDSMESIVVAFDEIVIYGAGSMGQAIIRNLTDRGWWERICCCAVKDMFGNPKEIMGIPVLEFAYLPHFRKSACFIIAVADDKQLEIYNELARFGCENIIAVEYSYALELERGQNLGRAERTIFHLQEQIGYLTKKIDDLQYRILEQNEICATNTKAFKEYENCNYGRDVALIGTGPTLQYYIPKEAAIHIGVNFSWKRKDIPFDYYFIQDGNRNESYREMLEGVLENINGDIFIGRFSQGCLYKDIEFPVIITSSNKRIRRYWLEQDNFKEPYQNICYHAVSDYRSVIFAALHFALYTNPKRIYLVGCDVTSGHFSESVNCPVSPEVYRQIKRWKCGYARMRKFAEKYYPETEIISVNPIGLKGLFTDDYTSNFLKAMEKRNET